jgi:hypothetical protein
VWPATSCDTHTHVLCFWSFIVAGIADLAGTPLTFGRSYTTLCFVTTTRVKSKVNET